MFLLELLKKYSALIYLKKLKLFFSVNFKCLDYLKKCNYSSIKPFKVLHWHNDTYYYSAFDNNEKIFVKVSTDMSKIKREVNNNCHVASFIDNENLVPMLDFSFSSFFSHITFKFVDGLEKLSKSNFDNFSKPILKILININNKGFIHRDIKPDNFIIENGIIKIIDFEFLTTFSFDSNFELDLTKKENIIKLVNCGSSFKKGPLVWNDFYSFVLLNKKFNCNMFENDEKLNDYLENSTYSILKTVR